MAAPMNREIPNQKEIDIFDDIILADEKSQHIGYSEGYQIGQQQGYEQGRKIGKEQACKVGSEFGFYCGFACTLKDSLEREGTPKTRKMMALSSLIELLNNFNIIDHHNESYSTSLDKIRAKFKQVMPTTRFQIVVRILLNGYQVLIGGNLD